MVCDAGGWCNTDSASVFSGDLPHASGSGQLASCPGPVVCTHAPLMYAHKKATTLCCAYIVKMYAHKKATTLCCAYIVKEEALPFCKSKHCPIIRAYGRCNFVHPQDVSGGQINEDEDAQLRMQSCTE